MESTNLTPQSISVVGLLSGIPAQSLSDARKILMYLRTQIGTKAISNLDKLRENDVAWHMLFSADIYLWNQQRLEDRVRSNKNRWGFYNANRTKTSL
jgi:hypothetical protein